MPKLILKERGKNEEKNIEFGREEIQIGRDSTNSLVLEGAGVSRKHALIIPQNGDYYLKDLGSRGGTRINGMRVPKEEKYILKNNDIIQIENFDLRFMSVDDVLNQSFNEVTDSDILEVKLLKKVLRALDRESLPSIEVLNGIAEGKKAFITDDLQEISIGRDPLTDFPIEEYVISRNHAKIVKKWGGVVIVDNESKNGVFVNNRRVREEFLHDGDRIALGTIVLIFRNPKEIDLEKIGEEMREKKIRDYEKAEKEKETAAAEAAAEQEAEEEDLSVQAEALPEKDQLALVKKAEEAKYPVPHEKKQRIKFSAMEISIIGIGVLVFIFALIMLVNVFFS